MADMTPDDMARSLRAFPDTAPLAQGMVEQWHNGPTITLPGVTARIILGDARDTLPVWQGRADAWFLDGFSPAKNPQMWDPALLQQVAAHTAPSEGGRS